ncbi:hypothetical protein ACIPVB_01940 [Microbacterium sp. NPDC090007]|uniref:hypothetical protein n=1 Tax=Microbacterium sp. NPDC090007 TaxID=3364204 RepID=UPI003804DE2C
MFFEMSVDGGRCGVAASTQILLVRADGDDLSMLISSFRETKEAISGDDELKRRVGAHFDELSDAIRQLFVISGVLRRVPKEKSSVRFAISEGDREILKDVSDPSCSADVKAKWPPGSFRLLTTVHTLATSLSCIGVMLNYLWVEEVPLLTGYELEEVEYFRDSLESCLVQARPHASE